jgi:hypothetical protein
MTRIITLQEVQGVKPLSAHVKDKFFNQFIEDAQISLLKPLIGSELYNAIIKEPSDYTELLEGGFYDDDKRSHSGLKRVLIEFTYTLYMFESADVSTPFGMIVKDFKDGQKIDRQREKELKTKRQQIASQYWHEVQHFIFFTEELRVMFRGSPEANRTYKSQTIKRDQWL